jgi:hypothetical protein
MARPLSDTDSDDESDTDSDDDNDDRPLTIKFGTATASPTSNPIKPGATGDRMSPVPINPIVKVDDKLKRISPLPNPIEPGVTGDDTSTVPINSTVKVDDKLKTISPLSNPVEPGLTGDGTSPVLSPPSTEKSPLALMSPRSFLSPLSIPELSPTATDSPMLLSPARKKITFRVKASSRLPERKVISPVPSLAKTFSVEPEKAAPVSVPLENMHEAFEESQSSTEVMITKLPVETMISASKTIEPVPASQIAIAIASMDLSSKHILERVHKSVTSQMLTIPTGLTRLHDILLSPQPVTTQSICINGFECEMESMKRAIVYHLPCPNFKYLPDNLNQSLSFDASAHLLIIRDLVYESNSIFNTSLTQMLKIRPGSIQHLWGGHVRHVISGQVRLPKNIDSFTSPQAVWTVNGPLIVIPLRSCPLENGPSFQSQTTKAEVLSLTWKGT